jgi:hypothetical protein
MLSVGLSPPEPAFKFVLIFMFLLPSLFLKAVRMPIANALQHHLAHRREVVVMNWDESR